MATDHFEELGRPPKLFHGGFGLLTVGNLRKPRFWALRMLSQLDGGRVPARVSGDGAEALVEALATRTGDGGSVDVLCWNGTLDQTKIDGAAALDREARVEVGGLTPGAAYAVTLRRVDETHSNIKAVWDAVDGGHSDWPNDRQWAELRAADELFEEPYGTVTAGADGSLALTVDLPMPGIRALRLTRTGGA